MPKHSLEPWKRRTLQNMLNPLLRTARRFGDKVKQRNGEKQCIRIKRMPKWIKKKNTITAFPKYLKPHHVAYMLYYDVELPDVTLRVEVCHRCCDPNPQKRSRRSTGAQCIEPTHLDLRSHQKNMGQTKCHRRIRFFALNPNNMRDPSIRTTGTIYVADTFRADSEDTFECKHRPFCFGCFGKV